MPSCNEQHLNKPKKGWMTQSCESLNQKETVQSGSQPAGTELPEALLTVSVSLVLSTNRCAISWGMWPHPEIPKSANILARLNNTTGIMSCSSVNPWPNFEMDSMKHGCVEDTGGEYWLQHDGSMSLTCWLNRYTWKLQLCHSHKFMVTFTRLGSGWQISLHEKTSLKR